MKIFTWHIHSSYLYYLSKGNYNIYIPVKDNKAEGYRGRGETFAFGANVIEIPANEVKNHDFDCILLQTSQNYAVDQFEILSDEQRGLPKIYLEHDLPQGHPTDNRHIIDDPEMVLVHVTHYNKLMWDNNNQTHVRVIEHGVTMPEVDYSGNINKGIVVMNNLQSRGRSSGSDIFNQVKEYVPLDLIGKGNDEWGIEPMAHTRLPFFEAEYRFFFNPTRYASLSLAVCEAMMLGIPVVALATAELTTVIDNGYSGFIHTDPNYLIDKMKMLLGDKDMAQDIGANGREVAMKRFNIKRFTREWEELFMMVTGKNLLKSIAAILQ